MRVLIAFYQKKKKRKKNETQKLEKKKEKKKPLSRTITQNVTQQTNIQLVFHLRGWFQIYFLTIFFPGSIFAFKWVTEVEFCSST